MFNTRHVAAQCMENSLQSLNNSAEEKNEIFNSTSKPNGEQRSSIDSNVRLSRIAKYIVTYLAWVTTMEDRAL